MHNLSKRSIGLPQKKWIEKIKERIGKNLYHEIPTAQDIDRSGENICMPMSRSG